MWVTGLQPARERATLLDMVALLVDPATVLREGDSWRVVLNKNQNLLGKTMLVLRREASDVLDVTLEEWDAFTDELRRVRRAVDELFHPDRGTTPSS